MSEKSRPITTVSKCAAVLTLLAILNPWLANTTSK
jgi:hypothetical protein